MKNSSESFQYVIQLSRIDHFPRSNRKVSKRMIQIEYKISFNEHCKKRKKEDKVSVRLIREQGSFRGVGFRGRQIRRGEGRVARTKGTERSSNASPRGAKNRCRAPKEAKNVRTY